MRLLAVWRKYLRRFVPLSAYPILGGVYRAAASRSLRELAVADRAYVAQHGLTDIPPAPLRFRVVGACDMDQFVRGGAAARRDIERALSQVGRTLDDFSDALDFGCGCGRALRAFKDRPGGPRLSGTDIDAEAIGWCQEHLPFARFDVNGALQPLRYPDRQFDLVWSLSVFTHLDERYQFAWLAEMRRVIRPGGYLLATVHGRRTWETLPPWVVRKIERQGFVYAKVPGLKGVFPDWYQAAWHLPAYVQAEWSRYFAVAAYIPCGLDNYQDIVVLRRPD